MFRDIRAMLAVLHKQREVVVISEEVSADQELAEIHRRVIAANGPALFFERVKGSDMPVVTNLFGTTSRAALVFGSDPQRTVQQVVDLVKGPIPPPLSTLWRQRHLLGTARRLGVKRVSRGPVTEVVGPCDLDRLPMIKQWPQDGGDFITLPLVYTQHPENGSPNLGMYRIQRHGKALAGMHWQIGKGGGFHHHVARQKGQALPVVVSVGGPPALILSAIAPLPENVPEVLLASLIADQKIRMVEAPNGLSMFADAEVALVGHVPPDELHPEGPFGDHYGYYSYQHDYPVFHVQTVAQRQKPIWPATIVGKPRQEDLFIGDLLQELLSPLFPLVMPGVVDLWSYGETGYHALAGAVVRERYKREAFASGLRILGEGQLSLTKFLWVLDKAVDLRDVRKVLPLLLERFRPETDLFVFSNVSMDTLDYTGPKVNEGSKALMLGVGEPWRTLPEVFLGPLPAGLRKAEVFCPGVLCVSGIPYTDDPALCAQIAGELSEWPLIVLCDDATRCASTPTRWLWTTFTKMEPAADLHAAKSYVRRQHIAFEGSLLIDARSKPWHAEEVSCDPEIAQRVSAKWKRYFGDTHVEMGDGDEGHLDKR